MFVFIAGCSLDLNNPNSPTEEVIDSYDGLVLLGVGLQSRLSQGIGQFITVSGAVSGETSPVIAYLDYQPLRMYTNPASRLPMDKDLTYVRLIWREQFRIVKTANDILNNVNSVSMSAESRRSFIALAKLGKVMSFYYILQCWEKLPINTDADHPQFVDRAAALNECESLLNDASAQLEAGAIPADFSTKVLGKGFDLVNLVKAYKAKIYLMKGDYANAAIAAQSVTAAAYYTFTEGTGLNPLWDHFTRGLFTKVMAYWAENAEAGDTRIPATVDLSSREGRYGNDTVYTIIKYNTQSTPYYIYTLNEMTLIKAECYARGSGGDPVAAVNQIRTSAGLPPFSGSTTILEEIFKQRFYELCLTGQHWEDFRRFKNDGIAYVNNMIAQQLAHWWLYYPDWEIDKNPNTPSQPIDVNLGL